MGQVYQKQVSHTPKPSCVHPLSHLHHLSSRPALTSSTADPQPHQPLLTRQGQRVSTEEDQTLVFQESSSVRLLISKAVPQAFTTWCHMSTAGLESCSQKARSSPALHQPPSPSKGRTEEGLMLERCLHFAVPKFFTELQSSAGCATTFISKK